MEHRVNTSPGWRYLFGSQPTLSKTPNFSLYIPPRGIAPIRFRAIGCTSIAPFAMWTCVILRHRKRSELLLRNETKSLLEEGRISFIVSKSDLSFCFITISHAARSRKIPLVCISGVFLLSAFTIPTEKPNEKTTFNIFRTQRRILARPINFNISRKGRRDLFARKN